MFLATWKQIPQENEIQSKIDNVPLNAGTAPSIPMLIAAAIFWFLVSINIYSYAFLVSVAILYSLVYMYTGAY